MNKDGQSLLKKDSTMIYACERKDFNKLWPTHPSMAHSSIYFNKTDEFTINSYYFTKYMKELWVEFLDSSANLYKVFMNIDAQPPVIV